RVRVAGQELSASIPEDARGAIMLACYAHDILFAQEIPQGISARNCFWASVAHVEESAGALLVTLAELPLRALITREAGAALKIEPGLRVVTILKATSLVYAGKPPQS